GAELVVARVEAPEMEAAIGLDAAGSALAVVAAFEKKLGAGGVRRRIFDFATHGDDWGPGETDRNGAGFLGCSHGGCGPDGTAPGGSVLHIGGAIGAL